MKMTKKDLIVLLTIAVLSAMVMMTGCTHNLTELNKDGVYARTSVANVSMIDVEGNQSASQNGAGPLVLKQDKDGNWLNMGGIAGLMSAPVPGTDKVAFIVSPGDVEIAKLSYSLDPCTGERNVLIEGLKVNMSEPLSQQVAALAIALPTLKDMTKEEALATVEKWKVAGEIAPTVANLLTQIIATW